MLYLGVTEGTTLIRKTVIEFGLQAKFLAYHLPELLSGGSFSPPKLIKEKLFKIPVHGFQHQLDGSIQMEKEVPLSIRAVFFIKISPFVPLSSPIDNPQEKGKERVERKNAASY